MADSHACETKKKQSRDEKAGHGTASVFFCLPVENPPSVQLFFTTLNLLHIRVGRTESPHCARAVHVPMGLPLLYGSPPRRGRERIVPVRALPHAPLELRTET